MGRPTILIVDDEPTNIQALAAHLGEEFEVRFALGGTDALRIMEESDIDLVLLDMVMPGMSGLEVLASIKANPEKAQIPVIFVTASGDEADEATGLDRGAVDYVVKPFRPAVVLARIRTHLELRRQRQLLERHAFIDSLTGIGNRRRFDEALKSTWSNAMEDSSALALAIIDIDHFKRYNDHYGHPQGDRALQQVAEVLSDAVSHQEATPTRYGGEEFALILSSATQQKIRETVVSMMNGIQRAKIAHKASLVTDSLTLSIGVVSLFPTEKDDPNMLVQLADKQLYLAKESGRNQVRLEIYDHEGTKTTYEIT